MSFYAVAVGVKPGIYSAWTECESNAKGFEWAKFENFMTTAQADNCIRRNSVSMDSHSNVNANTAVKSTSSLSLLEESRNYLQNRKMLINSSLQTSSENEDTQFLSISQPATGLVSIIFVSIIQ